jgi:hypothetical protein
VGATRAQPCSRKNSNENAPYADPGRTYARSVFRLGAPDYKPEGPRGGTRATAMKRRSPLFQILISSTTIRATRFAPIWSVRAPLDVGVRFGRVPHIAARHAMNHQPIGVGDSFDHQHTTFPAQRAFHRVSVHRGNRHCCVAGTGHHRTAGEAAALMSVRRMDVRRPMAEVQTRTPPRRCVPLPGTACDDGDEVHRAAGFRLNERRVLRSRISAGASGLAQRKGHESRTSFWMETMLHTPAA